MSYKIYKTGEKKEVEVKLACTPSVGLPGNIHVQWEIALNSTQKKS